MTWETGRPWFYSVVFHSLALLLVAVLVIPNLRQPPSVLRLRLSAPSSGSISSKSVDSPRPWKLPSGSASQANEPASPAWRNSVPVSPVPVNPVLATVSLDELIGPTRSQQAEPTPAEGVETVWKSSGVNGYRPPPLPPPGLVPPQGARWSLDLTIPPGGGFALGIEGLDSGHPDLDRWLETYLRSVSFPAGLTDQAYRVTWTLRLDSGRPQ